MSLFTVKYAPQNLAQVFGQQMAISQLKDYILSYKKQEKKAALLLGPLGCGKTSSVYALIKEIGYDILEINSSDLRNEEAMRHFLSSALGQQSLFFTPKLILIDEIDNISGTHDRGAISALLKAIEKSKYPVILSANDVSESKFKALVKGCLVIDYHALQYRTIAHALQWVCEQEEISFDEQALTALARHADGDLRGALLDLQVCSTNKKITMDKVLSLSDRNRMQSMTEALTRIFKSSSVENALPALDSVDCDMDEIFFWIDENLPKEYLTPQSLSKAYEHLSRADVFYGRIRRWQHWHFLVYVSNLLTAGISSAKDEKNPQFISYRPTMRILRMWQAKMKNAKKKDIAKKLALATHTSQKVALEHVPYFSAMFRAKKNEEIVRELSLNEEEVDWLRKE